MKRYGVIGWKNSGKTTLVERLVAEISERGLRVSTVKHAHHAFEADQPGKDSWRHRMAGAVETLVVSSKRWALMHELRDAPEPPLEGLIDAMHPVDLLLIEGYKRDRHPKVEAFRAASKGELIAPNDPTVRAVASDTPLHGVELGRPLPRFHLDQVPEIADFILADCGFST